MRQARRHPTIARPRSGPGDKASEQAATPAAWSGFTQRNAELAASLTQQ
jgi:hypothetical protein